MPSSPAVRAGGFAGSLASVAGVAAAGGLVTWRRLGWYRSLDRPGWTPPDAVFAAIWSILYAEQAVAAWLVWRSGDDHDAIDVPAFSSYGLQLGLNLAWTLLFFGVRRPALALLDICVLWVAIVVTIREFSRHHKLAAALLLPYLVWTTFAVALNADIWWRNR
jgi:tryptophan-rich sensory protein